MVGVLAARQRIHRQIDVTPLRRSAWLTSATETPLALKLECVQRTGSFKIRGALNALLGPSFRDGAASAGPHHVVTASAGNHGRAIALAAAAVGAKATVFAPRGAPAAKLDAIRRLGGELRLESSYDEAESAAMAFARERGLRFISPYNDADVIAGAGTIALELFDAQPSAATIVVPVGGGGLISGIAIASKSIAPGIRIVGVEAAASSAMSTSLRAGRITAVDPRPTLADGLAGNLEAGAMTFDIVRQYVDEIVTVSEEEIARAMRGLLAEEHLVVEGAGAAAVAAILAGTARAAGPTIAVVSGANIDRDRLNRRDWIAVKDRATQPDK
jgi:threonine dehydratase